MYTKCLYTKCIPHFDKLLYTFCIQNLAAIVPLILYTKYIQTFVEICYTFCIHFVYISCMHLVQFLYTKYIHSFSVGVGKELSTSTGVSGITWAKPIILSILKS